MRLLACLLWMVAAPALAVVDGRWPVEIDGGNLPGGALGIFCNAVAEASTCGGVAGPCFSGDTAVQDCIDHVESQDASSEFRTVYVYPGEYTDDVDCTPSSGRTSIVGMHGSTPAGSFGQITGPTIAGESGSVGVTMTVGTGDCSLYRLLINNGPDQDTTSCGGPSCSDTALSLVEGQGTASLSQISHVTVGTNATDGLGKSRLITVEDSTASFVFFDNLSAFCPASSTFFGAVDTNATSACLWMDTAGRVELTNSILRLEFLPATNSATFEVVSGNLRIIDTIFSCEKAGSNTPNCFEIDSDDANVDISLGVAFGGTVDPFSQSTFVEVVGSGTGSTFNLLTQISGSGAFTDNSVWGSGPVDPTWYAGCEVPVSVAFNLDESNTPHYTTIDNVTTTTTTEPVMDTTPNVFFVSRPMLATDFKARVNTNPGTNESVTFRLRDDGANTLKTCTINAAQTSCAQGAASPSRPIAASSILTLQVTHTGPTGLNTIDEAVVFFCLNTFPR